MFINELYASADADLYTFCAAKIIFLFFINFKNPPPPVRVPYSPPWLVSYKNAEDPEN